MKKDTLPNPEPKVKVIKGRRVQLKRVARGVKAGQFFFTLIGDNGEQVGQASEYYKREDKVLKTIRKYFTEFPRIVGIDGKLIPAPVKEVAETNG